jgi:hypothetical protein
MFTRDAHHRTHLCQLVLDTGTGTNADNITKYLLLVTPRDFRTSTSITTCVVTLVDNLGTFILQSLVTYGINTYRYDPNTPRHYFLAGRTYCGMDTLSCSSPSYHCYIQTSMDSNHTTLHARNRSNNDTVLTTLEQINYNHRDHEQ